MCNVLNPHGFEWQAGAHRSARTIRRVLAVALFAALALFVSAWRYQDLPMKECAWCHRTGILIGLNRHHVVPQSVDPARRDDPTVLVVLCRRDHAALGHPTGWNEYNPDVREIIEKYQRRLPCKKGE